MNKSKEELSRFLVVGFTTVGIDFLTYHLLLALNINLAIAKACGYLMGTLFAYFANRLWTFSYTGSHHRAFAFTAVYLTSFFLNVSTNSSIVMLLGRERGALLIAFLIATGLSAMFNFVGMKFFVFRRAL